MLLQVIFVELEAQAWAGWELHNAVAYLRFIAGGHRLYETAERSQGVFDLEEVFDGAGKMDGGVEVDKRAGPLCRPTGVRESWA